MTENLRYTWIIVVIAILFASCKNDIITSAEAELNNSEWAIKDSINLNVDISDIKRLIVRGVCHCCQGFAGGGHRVR